MALSRERHALPRRVSFVCWETESRDAQCVMGLTVFSFSFTKATSADGEIGLTT